MRSTITVRSTPVTATPATQPAPPAAGKRLHDDVDFIGDEAFNDMIRQAQQRTPAQNAAELAEDHRRVCHDAAARLLRTA